MSCAAVLQLQASYKSKAHLQFGHDPGAGAGQQLVSGMLCKFATATTKAAASRAELCPNERGFAAQGCS